MTSFPWEAGEENKIPIMPAEGFKWNQLGDLAKKFYLDYEKNDFKALLFLFNQTVEEILKIIEIQNENQLYTVGFYKWTGGKWPLGR